MKLGNIVFPLFLTGAIVIFVLAVTNGNIEIKVDNKGERVSTLGQNNVSSPQQTDSMADHHKPQPTDSKIFDSLVGKQAPDFTLEDYSGKKITLSSLKGKNVILFFNEGLMCYPACWNQIVAFGKDNEFNSKNTVVLNITVDPKNEWKQAVDKMPELSAATVLFDSDRKISTVYGVLGLPSSMHRGQFPGHSYVIIDKEGTIRFARDDEQMAVRNKEMIAEIDKI